MPSPISLQTFRDAAEVYRDDDSVRLNREVDGELVPFGSKSFFSVSFFTSSTAKENMAVRWQFLNALATVNNIDKERLVELAKELHIDNPEHALNAGSQPLTMRTVRALLAKYDTEKNISILKKTNVSFQERFVNFPKDSAGAKLAAAIQSQVDKMLQRIKNFSDGMDTYEGTNLKYDELDSQLTALKNYINEINIKVGYAFHDEIYPNSERSIRSNGNDFNIKSAEHWCNAILRGMKKIFDANSGNFDADLLENFGRTIGKVYSQTYVRPLSMVLDPEIAEDLEKKCMDFLDTLFTDDNAKITGKMLNDIENKSCEVMRNSTDVILKMTTKLPSPADLRKSYPHISQRNMSTYIAVLDKLKLKSENVYLALTSFEDMKKVIFDCEFVKYCKKKPWYQNCIQRLKKEVMDLIGANISFNEKQLEEGITDMVDRKIQSRYQSDNLKFILSNSDFPLQLEKFGETFQRMFTTEMTNANKHQFMDMLPKVQNSAPDENGSSGQSFSDFGELLFRISLGKVTDIKPLAGGEKSNEENPPSPLQPYVDKELHDGVLKDLKKMIPQLQSLSTEDVIQPADADASLYVIFNHYFKDKLAPGDLALFSRHSECCNSLLDALSKQDVSFDLNGSLKVIQDFFENYKAIKADIFKQGEETVKQMEKKISPDDVNNKAKRQQLEADIQEFNRDLKATFNGKFINLTMFCIRKWEKIANKPFSDVRNQSLIANLRKIYARMIEYDGELSKKIDKEEEDNPQYEKLEKKQTLLQEFFRSLKTTAIGMSFEIELNDIAVTSSEKKAIDKWIETAFNE